MDDIEKLLNKFNSMEPISSEYRNALSKMLPKLVKQNGYVFLRPGKIARKSWYLVSGFIVALDKDANDHPIVVDIYTAEDLVIDLLSFFKKVPVKYKFVAIGKVEVLEFRQTYLSQLTRFQEPAKLVQQISFQNIQHNQAKQELFLLPAKERVIRFFKDYNVSGLPDKYCASLLRMGLEKYIELKVILLKSGEIEMSAEVPVSNSNTYGMHLAYEVKAYLLENYTRPDIDDIVKIAALFNTTKKTLTRHFKNNLHVTVHQLILKLRMEKAHQLLSVHKIPVKEVYQLVGYKDVYNFSRIFKHHFGRSAKDTIKKEMPYFSKIVTTGCIIAENFVPNLHFMLSLL